ncbi:FAD-binding protein [Microbulbifer sp. 2205BS26-8]|uniref:FAD-binding protein n=1 Tax=Microbulbifer sp. 2205BS26-8 TaxID=3064386 RepID=UPI00273F3A8F|nr:FAD-binding protein [Microbulbifer sp. 2205BS26-8]MDP5209549.1 FAD-binding protein [Microbulbifer sp. 2205BS26-8]
MTEQQNNQWDESVDVLVVGTGNGGLTSALCNKLMGAGDVLIIEKSMKIGGTSATSGGGIWIPCSHYAKQAGAEDTLSEAQEYLDQTLAGEDVPSKLVRSYLENGPRMLKFLHDKTLVRYESLAQYPDYYSTLPGAKQGHRSLEPAPINASELGEDYRKLTYTHHMMRLFGVIHFTQAEAHLLMLKLPGYHKVLRRMIWDYISDIPWRLKSRISRRLCCGSAGIARLYLSIKQVGIPIWFSSPMSRLVEQGGRIVGIEVNRDGRLTRIQTRKAVVLAAGGFEKNQKMRDQYLPKPTNTEWSAGTTGSTGDAITAGINLGAVTRLMGNAWWCTTLCVPDEPAPRLSIMEKSFPGSCVVNKAGHRFANESQNYMAFQKAQFKAHSDDTPCAPAFHIFDTRFRRNYMAGPLMTKSSKPDWSIPRKWYDMGFVGKASTIAELAVQMDIDPKGLSTTIEKMNRYAVTGIDEDFHRGEADYDRYYADPKIKPNPCLASIDEAPFYAMRIEAGDFGTAGGLSTNADAQVLREDGSTIDGLYAIGNCAAAILPTYPGPGSTLGPAMTMGYQAAKKITGYTE